MQRFIKDYLYKCRYDFIEFIRNGGRRPHVLPPEGVQRQLSIELSSENSNEGSTHGRPAAAPPQ